MEAKDYAIVAAILTAGSVSPGQLTAEMTVEQFHTFLDLLQPERPQSGGRSNPSVAFE